MAEAIGLRTGRSAAGRCAVTGRAAGLVGCRAGCDRGTDVQRLAAAYLSRVAEPGSVPLWMFVSQHGYPAAAAAVRAGDVPPAVAACTEARRQSADPEADLAAAERNRIRLLTPGRRGVAALRLRRARGRWPSAGWPSGGPVSAAGRLGVS